MCVFQHIETLEGFNMDTYEPGTGKGNPQDWYNQTLAILSAIGNREVVQPAAQNNVIDFAKARLKSLCIKNDF